MIDFNNLNQYRENNRIEAKKALGGLPKSIWETYSAFANTLGGIILLGVAENDDKSFSAVDLPSPEKLIKEFWDSVNNPKTVSINIMSDKDVFIEESEGKKIVVINVPRADRAYRPVYIDGNPLNTYRRNGEGDYKCTKEEYQSMVRDSSVRTQDMLVLTEMDYSVFNYESIGGFRRRMRFSRPGHVWESLEDDDFLLKIGAAGIGNDGKKHPTAAGLLMFGNEYDIVREYNDYFLDYQEQYDPHNRWTDRIISSSGDWSGNIFDFYFRVYNKLQQDIKTPFMLNGITRVEDTPVHQALREALVNCLVNADYYGRRGVVVIKRPEMLSFSNPGNLRIELSAAISGGVSDPRNSAILKMFNFIDIGERAGSGIPNIYRVWNEQKMPAPIISEEFDPDRVTLILPITSAIIGDKSAITNNNEGSAIKTGDKSAINAAARENILYYLTDHPDGRTAEIAEYLGLGESRTRDYMRILTEEGLLESFGANRNRRYRLKR
ncbi:MAG: putative DNA binding domain-containing protein [Clostridia bacterium]|nr:putative DNA binding domain-containing protein [Clostridia bacterium]